MPRNGEVERFDLIRKNFLNSEASKLRETAADILASSSSSRFQRRLLPECSHHKNASSSSPPDTQTLNGQPRLLGLRAPQVWFLTYFWNNYIRSHSFDCILHWMSFYRTVFYWSPLFLLLSTRTNKTVSNRWHPDRNLNNHTSYI